jgi:hypothetical protein
LLWNCEGLAHVYDLVDINFLKQHDILLLTETFLLKDFSIPGYYSENVFGSHSGYGRPKHGISIYYNSKLGSLNNCSLLENFVILNFECLTVVCAYLNPNLKSDELWDELILSMEHVQHFEKLIFAGDFNCRLDKKCIKGEQILEFSNYNSLCLANSPPYQATYLCEKGSSVIDLIFYGSKIIPINFTVTDSFIRKHRFVSFKFKTKIIKSKNASQPNHRCIIDYEKMSELVNSNYRNKFQEDLAKNDSTSFYNNILTLVDDSKCYKNFFRRFSQPWFDHECYIFKADLNFLRSIIDQFCIYEKYENMTPAEKTEILGIFSTAKKEYRKLCKNKKMSYQEAADNKIIEEAELTCYKILKINKKQKYLEMEVSLETWERSFNKIFNTQKLKHAESLNLNSYLKRYKKSIKVHYFSESEIEFAIKGLKNKKAPGPDSITNETIKMLFSLLAPELTKFFNLCLITGSFPEAWKRANLKLLFKGKGETTNVNNYRGISLSCTLYNLLDKILNNRVYSTFIDEIPRNQFGFIRGRSTTHAISKLSKEINQSVYVEKIPLYALFLDVKKAFDSIDRKFIFTKLIDSGKLSFEELNLMSSMFDTNYLIINDGVCISDPIIQTNGVRQGGCLSPFLFIYSINDINELLKKYPNVKMLLYADDIVLLCKNLNELRDVLVDIKNYLLQRKLQLNFEKCKIVKFRNGGKGRYKKDDHLEIDNIQIQFVPEFCYLGVVFQCSGTSFSKHVLKRAKASYFAISKLTKLTKSSIETALKLFDLAISPVASYGIESIWPYLKKSDFYTLETVKSRYLKKALGLSKYTKSRYTYKLANTDFFVRDLRDRFSLQSTAEYEKFLHNKNISLTEINPQFFETPAMTNPCWKNVNFEKRHAFTRYSCHGFHHLLCNNPNFHAIALDNCECKFCNEKIGQYHLFNCTVKQLSLTQASKMS